MNKSSALATLSGAVLAIAMAMMTWVIIGAAVAPADGRGAFDTWMGPAVALAGVALVLLLASKQAE